MAKLDFSYLVAPFTTADFFDHYWQKAALLIRRGEGDGEGEGDGDVNRYRGLIDAADADALIALAGELPAEAVEVIGRIRDGEISRERAGEATDVLADSFNQGATIRVKAIERFCGPLGALCKNLEDELGFPVHANLYCTPADSRGFNLHFDTHEVLVLQLLGNKQWQVFEPTARLPLEFVSQLPFEDNREALKRARGGMKAGGRDIRDEINETELGPLAIETVLEPGDCLYLPRGFVHQAAAHDEPSVHLTIGIHVLTWRDLLSVAMGQVACRHEDFRRALPVGLFNAQNDGDRAREFEKEFSALLQLLGRDADFANAVSEMAESFASRPRSGSAGDKRDAFGGVDGVDGVGSETKLTGNGPLRFYLAADGTMAGLACNGKELWLPVAFAAALRFVTEQSVFRPGEIPGLVGDNGKLAFVRHLIRDGFLRIAQQRQ